MTKANAKQRCREKIRPDIVHEKRESLRFTLAASNDRFRSVIARPGFPCKIRPCHRGKRLQDLQPGDSVLVRGQVELVIGVEINSSPVTRIQLQTPWK